MTDALQAECETLILAKLENAGPTGLRKTQLRLPKKSTRKGEVCEQVLQRLLRTGEIGNLGSPKYPRLVAKRYFRPLELAYEHIENLARENGPSLASKSRFERGLKGVVRARVDEALKLLVGEGRLLRLRFGGNPVYLHVSSLPSKLPDTAPAPRLPTIDTIRSAWRGVASRYSYPDVPIAEVYRAWADTHGDNLAGFKAALLQACREGRAVAGGGDWSLASQDERGAAIEINGRPHLRIRFLEKS